MVSRYLQFTLTGRENQEKEIAVKNGLRGAAAAYVDELPPDAAEHFL